MTTRREALVMIGVVPVALSMRVSNAAAVRANQANEIGVREASFVADRELRLTVSDNLQRQTWLYAGQLYTEEGSAITVNENEVLRLALINDTERAQTLVFDGTRFDLAARETQTLDLIFDQLQAKSLSNPAAGVALTIKVRPSYQTHALLAA